MPLNLAQLDRLRAVPLIDRPDPVLPARPDARVIVRHTHALHPTLPTRTAQALYLLAAPDGWTTEPPAKPWDLNDWLVWVDRTTNERKQVREVLKTSLSGVVTTWSDALRLRDVATVARWFRDDRSPERIAAHRTAAREGLTQAVHAPWLSDQDLHDHPDAIAFHLRDHEAFLGLLLATGALPDHGALFEAVDHPNPRLAHRLLWARPDDLPWDFATKGLTTPMESAVSNPWSTVIDLLDLLHGLKTPMDRPGLSRQTLLQAACTQGNRRAVRWLLEQGVDPNAWDEAGQHTALHLAADRNDPVLIDLLVLAGADVHAGHARLLKSAAPDHPSRAQALRATPVRSALVTGATCALEALLEHGAALSLQPSRPYLPDDGDDPTAAALAQEAGQQIYSGDGGNVRKLEAQRMAQVVEQAVLRRALDRSVEAAALPSRGRARL